MSSGQPARTDEEILSALERWLVRKTDKDEILITLMFPDQDRKVSYTFRQILEEVRNKTEIGNRLVTKLKEMAGQHDCDIIEFIDSST